MAISIGNQYSKSKFKGHSAPLVTKDARRRAVVNAYGLLVVLFAVTMAVGQVGISLSRILFIFGCVVVAGQAYRVGGLGLHVQIVICLFTFAPFLRRWVDMHIGYDANGLMLVGPLLALTVVFAELRRVLWIQPRSLQRLAPHLVALACLTYGWAISSFENDLLQGSVVAAKYMIPIVYCICIMLRPEQGQVILTAAARAFLVVGPIIGIYGVFQHLVPQPWDQLWMINSKIDSIGLPLPGKVRVFGTMNSPVSFASYATCGLLLFSFVRPTFLPKILMPIVAILPLSLGLLLSGVRAAWISAVVSLIICFACRQTRRQAGWLIVCLAVGVGFALSFTSFGDVIGDRINSLSGNISDDGSGSARLDDYFHVFGGDGRYLFGVGFGYNYDHEMNALDGLLLSSAVQMGTVLGVLHTLAVVWAGVSATRSVLSETNSMRIVACALVLGDLAILLLTSISVGEIGFLYWMLVGVLRRPFRSSPRDWSRLGAVDKPPLVVLAKNLV